MLKLKPKIETILEDLYDSKWLLFIDINAYIKYVFCSKSSDLLHQFTRQLMSDW